MWCNLYDRAAHLPHLEATGYFRGTLDLGHVHMPPETPAMALPS